MNGLMPVSKQNPSVVEAKKKWQEFVHVGDLENVKVWKYYLGEPPPTLSKEQEQDLIAELFADMVAVGALVLPKKYPAESFVFEIVDVEKSHGMNIRLKNSRKPGFKTLNPRRHLGPKVRMGGVEVHNYLGNLQRGMNHYL